MSTRGPVAVDETPHEEAGHPSGDPPGGLYPNQLAPAHPQGIAMGITNSPKLRFPVAMAEKLTSHMTATIAQPKKIPLEPIKPLSGGGKSPAECKLDDSRAGGLGPDDSGLVKLVDLQPVQS